MKLNKNVLLSVVLMVVITSVYRILPNRPMGFAPQIALALFGGAFFVSNKKLAFMLPLISMFYLISYTKDYSDLDILTFKVFIADNG